MPLSDRKAGSTNYLLNKILIIRSAPVVRFISIFSLNNSDNLKVRALLFLYSYLVPPEGRKIKGKKFLKFISLLIFNLKMYY